MSNVISPRPRLVRGKRSFTIVASQFNAQYVQGLVTHATEELRALAPGATITLHQVPGAFEIPVVVRELARQQKVDAIIAMAVILQGDTHHAENLSRSVTDALQADRGRSRRASHQHRPQPRQRDPGPRAVSRKQNQSRDRGGTRRR